MRETARDRTLPKEWTVIHPLDDVPERKQRTEGLGRITMTPAVRLSLMSLRIYLMIMLLLVLYRCLQLAGVLKGRTEL